MGSNFIERVGYIYILIPHRYYNLRLDKFIKNILNPNSEITYPHSIRCFHVINPYLPFYFLSSQTHQLIVARRKQVERVNSNYLREGVIKVMQLYPVKQVVVSKNIKLAVIVQEIWYLKNIRNRIFTNVLFSLIQIMDNLQVQALILNKYEFLFLQFLN